MSPTVEYLPEMQELPRTDNLASRNEATLVVSATLRTLAKACGQKKKRRDFRDSSAEVTRLVACRRQLR